MHSGVANLAFKYDCSNHFIFYGVLSGYSQGFNSSLQSDCLNPSGFQKVAFFMISSTF